MKSILTFNVAPNKAAVVYNIKCFHQSQITNGDTKSGHFPIRRYYHIDNGHLDNLSNITEFLRVKRIISNKRFIEPSNKIISNFDTIVMIITTFIYMRQGIYGSFFSE